MAAAKLEDTGERTILKVLGATQTNANRIQELSDKLWGHPTPATFAHPSCKRYGTGNPAQGWTHHQTAPTDNGGGAFDIAVEGFGAKIAADASGPQLLTGPERAELAVLIAGAVDV